MYCDIIVLVSLLLLFDQQKGGGGIHCLCNIVHVCIWGACKKYIYYELNRHKSGPAKTGLAGLAGS